ncbi:MAG: response regulator [Planctomycetota bacterium]|nr:MAG: response regulator [Planctomycetota bacterium]
MATVLVVDDNLVNQKLMQAIVQSIGHRAVVVANGKEAVEAVQLQRFDLVLMDLMMPVMDGFEATATIRTLPGQADLPIIAVTANTLTGSRERALASGCNAYIAKPYTKHDLVSAMNDWLRGSSDQYRPAKI